MEKLMNIWAKISSILIIPILILLVIFMIPVFTEGFSKGMGALFVSILILIFYAPLIYYAWFKKPNNKKMKMLAKIITILSIVIIIIDGTYKTFLELLILFTPVFYYAWRSENTKRGKNKK